MHSRCNGVFALSSMLVRLLWLCLEAITVQLPGQALEERRASGVDGRGLRAEPGLERPVFTYWVAVLVRRAAWRAEKKRVVRTLISFSRLAAVFANLPRPGRLRAA